MNIFNYDNETDPFLRIKLFSEKFLETTSFLESTDKIFLKNDYKTLGTSAFPVQCPLSPWDISVIIVS